MLLVLPRSVAVTPRPASPVVVQNETALQGAMELLKTGQRRLKTLVTDLAANESALLDSLK